MTQSIVTTCKQQWDTKFSNGHLVIRNPVSICVQGALLNWFQLAANGTNVDEHTHTLQQMTISALVETTAILPHCIHMLLCNVHMCAQTYIHTLCHGKQVDQREKVVHKTSTAHFQLPIQYTCNQVINYASPFPLTDQTNFPSPPPSATANNGAIAKLPSHDTS